MNAYRNVHTRFHLFFPLLFVDFKEKLKVSSSPIGKINMSHQPYNKAGRLFVRLQQNNTTLQLKMRIEYLASLQNSYLKNHKPLENIICNYHLPKAIAC